MVFIECSLLGAAKFSPCPYIRGAKGQSFKFLWDSTKNKHILEGRLIPIEEWNRKYATPLADAARGRLNYFGPVVTVIETPTDALRPQTSETDQSPKKKTKT